MLRKLVSYLCGGGVSSLPKEQVKVPIADRDTDNGYLISVSFISMQSGRKLDSRHGGDWDIGYLLVTGVQISGGHKHRILALC